VITTVRFAPSARRRNSVARAWPGPRAATIGHSCSHGRTPSTSAGFSTITAEAADRRLCIDAEHARGLRVQVTDVARVVDGDDAFDHTLQQRLRFRLAPRSAAVRSTRLRRMSSIVFASVVVSALPPAGIDVDRSPWPSRIADCVSALTGRAMRRPSTTPSTTASAPTTSAVHARRRTNRASDASILSAGQPHFEQRDALARRAKTGTLAA
jgi:hypothetical protein